MSGYVAEHLSNIETVCIVTDGIFKFCQNDTVLVSTGLAVKDDFWNRSGHACSFIELALGIFKSEVCVAFARMLHGMQKACMDLCEWNVLENIASHHD